MRGTLVLGIHFRYIVCHPDCTGMRHAAVVHRHVVFGCGCLRRSRNNRLNKLKHQHTNQQHKTQRPQGRSDCYW